MEVVLVYFAVRIVFKEQGIGACVVKRIGCESFIFDSDLGRVKGEVLEVIRFVQFCGDYNWMRFIIRDLRVKIDCLPGSLWIAATRQAQTRLFRSYQSRCPECLSPNSWLCLKCPRPSRVAILGG